MSDLPANGAVAGDALVFDGTSWAPGAASGGGLTSVSWDDVTDKPLTFPSDPVAWADILDKPLTFPSEAHVHVIADITDWLTRTLYVRDLDALNGIVVNTGLTAETGVTFYDEGGTGHDLYADSTHGLVSTSNMRVNYTDGGQLSVGATTGRIMLGFRPIDSVIGSAYYNGILLDSGIDITGSYGIRTGGNARFGGTLSVNGTGTFNGQVNADGGLRTDTIIEETAAAGVTVDGVLLKDNGVISAWTSVGASKTNVAASQTLTTVGTEFSNTYKLIDAVMAVTAASGTIAVNTYTLCNLSLTMVSGTPIVFSPTVNVISSTVNAGAMNVTIPSGSVQPVHFIFTNPGSAQAFGEGYLSVDVSGTSGDVIAAYTRARVTGSASGYGYRGYATGVSGGTGVLIGVDGYVNLVTGAAHTACIALSATVIGTAIGVGKRMALRGSDHVLIRGGSLIVASGTPATPDAVTTTHLTLTAKNSDIYAAGSAEIDGETFMDGNTSISVATTTSASYNAATATFIRADATSNNITVNLPAASGRAGRMYIVKKVDSSANTVTIDANASETIDGATTVVLTTQYEVQRLVCNGTNWDLV